MWNPRATTSALGAVCLVTWIGGSAVGGQKKPDSPAPTPGLLLLWEKKLALPGGASHAPWLSVGESSVFVVGPECVLTAYSPDGAILWASESMSDLPAVTAGPYIAIVSMGALQVVHQDTGTVAWRAEVEPAPSAIFVFDGRFGVIAGVELLTFSETGAPASRTPLGGAPTTEVVFRSGLLFVGLDQPSIVAIDGRTGVERWRARLSAAPQFLAAADDRVYFSAKDGALYAYRTTGAPELDWKFRRRRATGPPVADDRLVYFPLLDNTVRALARSSGSERWSGSVDSRIIGAPILLGASLAIALDTGEVVELRTKDGQRQSPATPAAPASPAKGPAPRLQAAAASHDASRVFTVTTDKAVDRWLSAWGRPSAKK